MVRLGRIGPGKGGVAVGTTFAAGLGSTGLATIKVEGTDSTENYLVPTMELRALENLRTRDITRV